jgi:hypothetical protein
MNQKILDILKTLTITDRLWIEFPSGLGTRQGITIAAWLEKTFCGVPRGVILTKAGHLRRADALSTKLLNVIIVPLPSRIDDEKFDAQALAASFAEREATFVLADGMGLHLGELRLIREACSRIPIFIGIHFDDRH